MKRKKEGIGRDIFLKRNDLGMTQKELADKVDTQENYISNIESGTKTPSIKLLLKICKALNAELKVV